MDEATLARLKRAAGPKPTGPAGPNSPRVVRRADLVAAITELEHCAAIADGTAFDVEEYDTTTAEGTQALIDHHRQRLQAQGFGGRA